MDENIRKAFKAWATLFIVFNLIMLILGLAILAWLETPLRLLGITEFQILLNSLEIGLGFNFCFSLGPIIEICSVWLFHLKWKSGVRNSLFVAGAGFAAMLLLLSGIGVAWTLSARFH